MVDLAWSKCTVFQVWDEWQVSHLAPYLPRCASWMAWQALQVLRQVLVALADMAGGAGDLGMCADQREPRLGVVERLDAPPCLLAVAAVAFLAEPPFVRVRSLVTVEALARCVAEFHGRAMAPLAACRLVRALELEVRESMIERLPVELDDVGAAALVIGMAGSAFGLRCIGPAAMEAAPLFAVRRNFLVAIQAQSRLPWPREWLVAIGAVLLELGMPLDQRTGHDHALEYVLRLHDPDRGRSQRPRQKCRQDLETSHSCTPFSRGGPRPRAGWP